MISHYIKRLGELFPEVKKATSKPVWEKWVDGRQTPLHFQWIKLFHLMPISEPQKKIYMGEAFKIVKAPHDKIITSHVFHVLPIACPRPRFTKFGSPYMPKPYVEWKKEMGKMITQMMEEKNMEMFVNPIKVVLEFHFFNENRPWGPHQSKPDIDNLVKAWMDAAQDVGLMSDDSIVYEVQASKHWGPSPQISMMIIHG